MPELHTLPWRRARLAVLTVMKLWGNDDHIGLSVITLTDIRSPKENLQYLKGQLAGERCVSMGLGATDIPHSSG